MARRLPRRPQKARWIAAWRGFSRAVKAVNTLTGLLAGLLIVTSCIVITNEVIWRYYLRQPHTWNLELNIFLLIGATFLAANYAQMKRAHVGTEVLRDPDVGALEPPAHSCRRRALAAALRVHRRESPGSTDWQAWSGDWRTDSTWAPPL